MYNERITLSVEVNNDGTLHADANGDVTLRVIDPSNLNTAGRIIAMLQLSKGKVRVYLDNKSGNYYLMVRDETEPCVSPEPASPEFNVGFFKLRFFRDLIQDQRKATFAPFVPDIAELYTENMPHSHEEHIFEHVMKSGNRMGFIELVTHALDMKENTLANLRNHIQTKYGV